MSLIWALLCLLLSNTTLLGYSNIVMSCGWCTWLSLIIDNFVILMKFVQLALANFFNLCKKVGMDSFFNALIHWKWYIIDYSGFNHVFSLSNFLIYKAEYGKFCSFLKDLVYSFLLDFLGFYWILDACNDCIYCPWKDC